MPCAPLGQLPPGLVTENVRIYIEIKNEFDQCSSEIQEVIDDMAAICMDAESIQDERDRALNTIIEALFPSLSVDLRQSEKAFCESPEALAIESEMEKEQGLFADRVREVMSTKEITQEQLAKKVGISQPAVSNLLTRTWGL